MANIDRILPRWPAACALLGLITFVAPALLFAQSFPQPFTHPTNTTPEDGLRREEQRARGLLRHSRPQANVLEPESVRLPPLDWQAESPCFPITEVALSGRDSQRFGWLHDAAMAYLNRCLGVQGLQRLVGTLDGQLIEQGFVTSRVSLPAQSLADGKLDIHLHVGRVANVTMRELPGIAGATPAVRWGGWRGALPVRSGTILNLRDIEQGIEQLQRLPSQSVGSNIVPGAEPDTSDLVLERTAGSLGQRLRGAISLDNAGGTDIGREQLAAYLSVDDPLGVNDILSLHLSTNLENTRADHRSQSAGLIYSVPWGYSTVTLSHSKSRFAQQVAGTTVRFLSSGKSETSDIKLHHTAFRTASSKTGLYGGLATRSAQSFLDDVELLVQRRRTSNVETGVSYQKLFARATLAVDLGLRRGLGSHGAQQDLPTAAAGGLTQQPTIWNLNGRLETPARIGAQKLYLDSRLQLRTTRDRTLAIDQFAIGGPGAVRGFDSQAALLAENGWSLRNEVSRALGTAGAWKGIGYVALDIGRVWGPSDELLIGQKLAGMAFGMRATVQTLQFELALGTPLYKPEGFPTQNVNVYLSGAIGF